MTVQPRLRMRQVMDWSAALWAGLVAGVVFLLLNMTLFPLTFGMSPWLLVRMMAAIVLGEEVLTPPATFDATATVVAMVVHFALSIIFAIVLAFIIHRWGLLVGIVGGALFGLGLYAINFYTLTAFFPWFFIIRSWIVVLTHIVFGAVAGGVYEGLEKEEFVPA